MGASERRKGQAYESLIRKWWKTHGFTPFNAAEAGTEGADIILTELPFLRGEVKRQQKNGLSAWMKQALDQAGPGMVGFVQHKRWSVGDTLEGVDEHYATFRNRDVRGLARLIHTLQSRWTAEELAKLMEECFGDEEGNAGN